MFFSVKFQQKLFISKYIANTAIQITFWSNLKTHFQIPVLLRRCDSGFLTFTKIHLILILSWNNNCIYIWYLQFAITQVCFLELYLQIRVCGFWVQNGTSYNLVAKLVLLGYYYYMHAYTAYKPEHTYNVSKQTFYIFSYINY